MTPNKKILHVTEALGGGVLNLISQVAVAQAADGFDVIVLYSTRPETPPEEQLSILFPPPIVRMQVPMVKPISPLMDLVGLVSLMKKIWEIHPWVIHLHSSKAGVLGRLAAYFTGYRQRVFYSPHGLSFLMQDVSIGKRRIYLLLEQVMAYLWGTFVASAETEANLARQRVKHKHVVLVENSIDLGSLCPKSNESRDKIKVTTLGRISYPKAPWRFKELAGRLSDESAEFVWIGDGELKKELLTNEDSQNNLTVSGWRKREDVFLDLSKSDVFVLLSLWEGMPLSLIEAQASGLPAVVADVVGCRDVVIDGETGYICSSMDDTIEKVKRLIRDRELRVSMGKKAREMAMKRFSTERMHQELLAVYGFQSPNRG